MLLMMHNRTLATKWTGLTQPSAVIQIRGLLKKFIFCTFWYYLGVGRYRHDNEDRKLSEKLHGNIFSGVNCIFWNSV